MSTATLNGLRNDDLGESSFNEQSDIIVAVVEVGLIVDQEMC